MVIILVNRFSKRLFLILYYKNINAKEAAQLYIYYVYRIYRLLDTILASIYFLAASTLATHNAKTSYNIREY